MITEGSMRKAYFYLVPAYLVLNLSGQVCAGPLDAVSKVMDSVTGKVPKTVESVGKAAGDVIDAYKGQPRIKHSHVITKVDIKNSPIEQMGKNGKINIGTKIRNANIKDSYIDTRINLRNSRVVQKGDGGEINIGTDIE